MEKLKVRFLLIVLLSVQGLYAQQYSFIRYSIEHGLAQSQVRSLYQDSKGYIWAGTHGGISRFDGIEFVNFSSDDGLPGNQINAITEDHNHVVWVGCKGAIAGYDGVKWTQFKLDSALSESFVLDITEDEDGNLWMGTDGAGLLKFNDGHFKLYDESDGLANTYVRQVVVGDRGLLLATKKGLVSMINDQFSTTVQQLADQNISSIDIDNKANIWVTTFGNGVFLVREGNMHHYSYEDGLVQNSVRYCLLDHSGGVWFATKRGVSHYDQKEFTSFHVEDGMPNENVRVVLEDFDHNIWFGTDGGGLLKFSGEAFVTYNKQNGLSSEIIMSVAQDSSNNLWFATYGDGVNVYNGKTFTRLDMTDGLSNNTVWVSFVDSKNGIWFGTSDGVSKWNGKSFENWSVADGLGAKKVWSICEGPDGAIWFGTIAGVSKFKNGAFTNYNAAEGKMGESVRAILKDKDNELWFATSNGLYATKDGVVKEVTNKYKLPTTVIYNVAQDDYGNIWLGTNKGLVLLNETGSQLFRLENDYSSNQVNFIVKDPRGNLWLGTNNGIFEYNVSYFLQTGKERITHYTLFDGLSSLESNQNAGFKDHEGDLWFGMASGLMKLRFAKRRSSEETVPPKVELTGIRLLLQKFDYAAYSDSVVRGMPLGLTLPATKNHLTFDYVGISNLQPDEVVYQYKLDGFDDDWLPVTKARFATYSNLPHGSYTFMLKAANKDGVWIDQPITYSFVINPPFYLTWWFIVFASIVSLSAAYLIYRWRKNVALEKERTKQLMYKSRMLQLEQQTLNASMNRHFIFNALNSIQYYINREDKLAANTYLSSFAKLIRKNLDSSQSNTVMLAEELERLRLYLKLENMRFADKFEYQINVEDGINVETVVIPAMLLQPYVENSIWHGILPLKKKGLIKINIKQGNNNELIFVIEDNGIGIEESKRRKGFDNNDHISQGMNITRNRLELMRKMTKENVYVKGPEEIVEEGITKGTRVEIGLVVNSFK